MPKLRVSSERRAALPVPVVLAFSWLSVFSLFAIACGPTRAQIGSSPLGSVTLAASPTPKTPPPASHPTPAPTPVPLSEVVTAAESAQVNLRNIEDDLNSDPVMSSANDDLPTFRRELAARLDENAKLLAASPSLDRLRGLASDWRQQGETLQQWITKLTTRAAQLDREIDLLAQLDLTWGQTLTSVKSSNAPADIQDRIKAIVTRTDTIGEKLAQRRSQILELQNAVVDEQARVADAQNAVRFARDDALSRLFVRDSPPVWSTEVLSRTGANLTVDSESTFSTQITALIAYAQRQQSHFLFHALVALLLLSTLRAVRKKIAPIRAADPDIAFATKIFDAPLSTALVISLLLCVWIYPEAPRLLWAIFGGVALVPTAILLRQITDKHLFALVKALLVFYFLDQIRSVAATLPVLSRFLFLGEIFAAIALLFWMIRTTKFTDTETNASSHFRRTVLIGARVALALFVLSFLANALGYVSLSNLVGDAVLRSADFAVFLFALLRIVDAILLLCLRIRPLTLLGMVTRHRAILYRRLHRVFAVVGILLWVLRTLDLLSLLGPAFQIVRGVLTAAVSIGSVRVSLGNVIAFAITVWSSVLISRFVRFLLDEDIYPRLSLPRGLPYAISTMLHYAVLVAGFFIAVAAMGFDMTKFTILAGAFGVGLGFGMQNIVNNFVSGLILLFERPINVGDVIQMDDASGVVQSIGIRASIIRTSSGSEIIVPNGKLISDRVTNWTLSNNLRGIVIPMTVASTTDPNKVIEVLTTVAAAHPQVAKDPPPQALFLKFSPAALDFELHAWTDQFATWEQIRSDLAVEINTAFSKESITMP